MTRRHSKSAFQGLPATLQQGQNLDSPLCTSKPLIISNTRFKQSKRKTPNLILKLQKGENATLELLELWDPFYKYKLTSYFTDDPLRFL